MEDFLCQHCIHWVDCSKDKPTGFCLIQDFFTYTKRNYCNDFIEGEPMSEEEWEGYNCKNTSKE